MEDEIIMSRSAFLRLKSLASLVSCGDNQMAIYEIQGMLDALESGEPIKKTTEEKFQRFYGTERRKA